MILKILKAFLDFFFPPLCFGCLKITNNENLCFSCLQKIFSQPIIVNKKIKIYALGYFNIPFNNLIYEFKYHHRLFLKEIFAKALSNIIINDYYLKNCDYLVPVPLHKAKIRERGYNQSEILAKEISKIVNKDVLNCLIRKKNTKSQTKLKGEKRIENVKNAFIFDNRYNIKDKRIILIDDVMTTGATLESCAEVLLENNAKEVFGLVIAVG
ncbi:MAG: ComF family protein [candidate division WOR-3 bacterium]|nr:ComF family protein [candidate division WOR-3 bacterium]MCX7837171.1 ComF family protein [candidate division WOR-3 bacterium]MDW8114194.1 ComF family protein [candidate division WOR-3 bacterium]